MNQIKIGDNILKLRKEKNITQEQLAEMLGITAGAISKWENGNSTPDIQLLAPIARALGTNIDYLLSFEQDLSDEDITKIKQELIDIFLHENYEKGEEKSKKYLQQYPNNMKLKFAVASLIQMYSMLDGKTEEILEKRMQYGIDLLNQVIQSNQTKYFNSALYLKASIKMVIGKYEESENTLNEMSKDYIDPTVLYIGLYERQEKFKEAKLYCEHALMKNLNESLTSLAVLTRLAKNEKDYEQAKIYLNGMSAIEETFDIGLATNFLHLSKLYSEVGDKKLAAEYIELYVDKLLKTNYDYSSNPYFKDYKLEVNIEGQRIIRKKLFQDLLQEYENHELLEYDSFRRAMNKLRVAVK